MIKAPDVSSSLWLNFSVLVESSYIICLISSYLLLHSFFFVLVPDINIDFLSFLFSMIFCSLHLSWVWSQPKQLGWVFVDYFFSWFYICSKSEYVIYKLKEMGKVSEKDIMQICDKFDRLDTGNCGKITLADLMENHHWYKQPLVRFLL